MVTREDIRSDLAVPPGLFLEEVLEDLGMSQAELARRMGRPPQAINEIIKGTKALTPETALQLEQVVGVGAHIWLGLESEYRLVLAEQEEVERIEAESALLDAFPYKQMVEVGCVVGVRKAADKVRELRRFFGVASLQQIGKVPVYGPAFRVGAADKDKSSYGLAAWLHCGYLQSKDVETAPFDPDRLRASIPALRALTNQPAGIVVGELQRILAECGVVFALFPHFPRTYAQGATFWVEPKKKALLLLSNRGKWADIVWFSFFHELGHILLHGNAAFVDLDRSVGERGPEEAEADAFAAGALLDLASYQDFVLAGGLSDASVVAFAAEHGIHPGIVVGRLQHDKLVGPDRLNYLREKYEWAKPSEESAA